MELRRDEMPTKGFYTYVHCRSDGTPFYVGKGSAGLNNSRAYDFTVSRNPAYLNCLNKHGQKNIHVRIYPRDAEQEAYTLEEQLIVSMRTSGFKLHNLAVGGRGGTSGVAPSAESNLKRSVALKGKPHLHGAKISSARKGIKYTPQAIANIAEGQQKRFAAMSAEKKRELVSPMVDRVITAEEIEKRGKAIKASWVNRKLRATISAGKEIK